MHLKSTTRVKNRQHEREGDIESVRGIESKREKETGKERERNRK
jgi:hypothetical protein